MMMINSMFTYFLTRPGIRLPLSSNSLSVICESPVYDLRKISLTARFKCAFFSAHRLGRMFSVSLFVSFFRRTLD